MQKKEKKSEIAFDPWMKISIKAMATVMAIFTIRDHKMTAMTMMLLMLLMTMVMMMMGDDKK